MAGCDGKASVWLKFYCLFVMVSRRRKSVFLEGFKGASGPSFQCYARLVRRMLKRGNDLSRINLAVKMHKRLRGIRQDHRHLRRTVQPVHFGLRIEWHSDVVMAPRQRREGNAVP